jgi:hypothetical protein
MKEHDDHAMQEILMLNCGQSDVGRTASEPAEVSK